MLTFLSRSWRRLVNKAPLGADAPAQPPEASAASTLHAAAAAEARDLMVLFDTAAAKAEAELRRPALRLIQGGAGAAPRSDTGVAVTSPAPAFAKPAAAAFVAGQGARLYSLDAFRRERTQPPPRTPRYA
jgi:hypothetical protein